MFTLDTIDDIHQRLGSAETLGRYLRALGEIGVVRYATSIADGHSVYRGADGQELAGPAMFEPLTIAGRSDTLAFQQVMEDVAEGRIGYVAMCRALADCGVDRWEFDTAAMTIRYIGSDGVEMSSEAIA